jgi:hypothetical protein
MESNNFDLGNTFKNIIHFLLILIITLIGIIVFFIVKNNQLAKELSEYTCETDIMEQDGLYNFIDSKGNMITTDADVLNKYTDDCVIRAISCATNRSWDSVYDYLSDIAQYEGTLFDKKDFVINYLDRTYTRLHNVYGTVGEISAMFPNNILLITMRGHIVCSKYGIIYDTFDCRNRIAEYIWLVE